ncbi:Retinol dehydrogenase 12 [Coemansia spiralis]|nr:Retinol dehydrogenase 12 [Coemansia spiralis]
MGLASAINWYQAALARRTLSGGALVQFCGFMPIWAGDFVFGFFNKFDVTTASAGSRIDRLVLQSREQAEKSVIPNEERLAIVTGANCGIGLETARAIGRAGYTTILACRNPTLGQEAVEQLERQTGLVGRFKFMQLDLASIESVDKFVSDIRAREGAIDLLVNNAGVMACPLSKTKDGIELQFGTNHVGHFVLTMGLLDQLKQARGGARIVVVSSVAALAQRKINYDLIVQEHRYRKWENYALVKLANLLFANALARKLEGTNVTVNSLHPGTVATNLMRHVGASWLNSIVQKVLFDDVHTGSVTSIYAALAPELASETGQFFSHGLHADMHPDGNNIEAQDELWDYTEKLVATIRASKA